MSESDYYVVLGVESKATPDEIKRAYREKMRRYHPDSLLGQMNKAKQVGDLKVIRSLERQIEESKQKTKQINIAYEVLSDPTKRDTYDRKRAGVPQQRTSIYHDGDPYRAGPYATRESTYQPRPQARPQARPSANADTFPTAWFAVLGVGLVLAFSFIFSLLWLPTNELPLANDGRYSAADLQATTSAAHATQKAESETMSGTFTALTMEEEINAGNTFLEIGAYELAIEQYTHAIQRGAIDPMLFVKRGVAYRNLGEATALTKALDDFGRAIKRDPTLSEAYLERALTQWQVWQANSDAQILARIQDDLAQYETLGGDMQDGRVQTLQAGLPK